MEEDEGDKFLMGLEGAVLGEEIGAAKGFEES